MVHASGNKFQSRELLALYQAMNWFSKTQVNTQGYVTAYLTDPSREKQMYFVFLGEGSPDFVEILREYRNSIDRNLRELYFSHNVFHTI